MLKRWKKWGLLVLGVFLGVFWVPFSVLAENGEERVAVYVQVPEDWENPCIWAWDEEGNNAFAAWPGEEMDADRGNEGWYYVWIPSWADHVIVNADEGDVQTGELVLEGRNTWIVVEDGENAELFTDPQTKGDIPEYVEKFVVRVKVDESWKEPCLWAWSAPDGTNAFAAWPGEALAEDGSGWLKISVPGWVNSVIVNGSEGSVQTGDLSVDTGKDVWVVVNSAEDASVFYEEPEGAVVAEGTAGETEEPMTAEETQEPGVEETGVSVEQSGSRAPVIILVVVVTAAVIAAAVVAGKKRKG